MIINPILYQQGAKLPELENPGTAADLLAGKQLVDQYGNPLTGTMPEVTQATPSISVSSSGLITASAAQDAGHVVAGTKSVTKQLTTQAGKTVTPTTYTQEAVASGRYTTGAVNVAGDANLKAENIKSGVSIFGVAGNAITCEIANLLLKNSSSIPVLFIFSDPNFEIIQLTLSANESGNYKVPKNSFLLVRHASRSKGYMAVKSVVSCALNTNFVGIKPHDTIDLLYIEGSNCYVHME